MLEDNLRIPSGASYPLFARDIERRITPSLFRDVHVRDNRDYPRLLRKSMDFVSTEGIAVVLTPRRYNSAFFEHAYLAEKTGAALAFPEDLEVVDNKVYFLDYSGKRHRVGVVYRRLSDEYLDPFAFNPDSVIGVSPCWSHRALYRRIVGWRGCHARLGEVYHSERWIGLDPTHNRMVDDNYITIAHGRDYRDCMLDIGIFSDCNVQQHQWVNASVHEQEL